MRAVRNTEAGIAIVEVDRPTAAGRIVSVTSAGICGSDLHALAAGASPVVLGHEFGGLLDDGTLVAVQPSRPCGSCPFCLRGADELCSEIAKHYYGVSVDGGLAEQVAVDERCLVTVAPSVDPASVGLVEPIAVAVHAVNRSAAKPGGRALVIGAGTIGLLCAAVLRHRGVDVDIAARHPRQREVAASLGAGLAPDRGYPVVFDAAGTSASFDQAARAAERGGQILLVALPWEPMGLSLRHVLKEISVVPAVYYGHHGGEREFDQAAHFLAEHPELPELLVTHSFGLAEAAEAFRVAADRAAGAIKIHLHP
jgi:threonine dehydrogenase-like Zn-dependent dehydrogenase